MEIEYNIDQEYLNNPLFVKWGRVISYSVQQQQKSEISNILKVNTSYVYQIINRLEIDKEFVEKRATNQSRSQHQINQKQKKKVLYLPQSLVRSYKRNMTQKISSLSINRGRTLQGTYYDKYSQPLVIRKNAIEKRVEYSNKYLNYKLTIRLFTDKTNFQLFSNKNYELILSEDEEVEANSPNPNYKIMVDAGRLILKFIDLIEKKSLTPHPIVKLSRHILLNPIEKAWAQMKRQIGSKIFDSVDDLIEAVQNVWRNIDQQHILNYIENHINTIQALTQNENKMS
ncbi:hypothetical protein ABPG72_019784 [Tetrahymena utriculariae]